MTSDTETLFEFQICELDVGPTLFLKHLTIVIPFGPLTPNFLSFIVNYLVANDLVLSDGLRAILDCGFNMVLLDCTPCPTLAIFVKFFKYTLSF